MKPANQRIKQAMRQNERDVLRFVRKYGVYKPLLIDKAWHNAIHRLIGAGKLRWSSRRGGYVLMKGSK